MGFNAAVVVLLDQLESIRNDASFGEKLAQAVLHKANRPNEDHSYITGQVQVIEVHHADSQMVVAVGGNTGKVLGYGGSYRSTPDEMIKRLNQDRLRRKREAAKL